VTSPRERFDPPVLRCRFTAPVDLSGAALLEMLGEHDGWDAARVARMLHHGGLFLDGRPYAADDLPERIAERTRVDAHAFAREPERVAIGREHVLAETDAWLAADKPPWITTQRSRASARLDLETALRALTGCDSLTAVHRLDRETSGVVLFARTRGAAAELGRAFAEGRVAKRYAARVAPAPARDAWEASGWLGRVLDPGRIRFALRADAAPGFRWSHTRFRVHLRDAGGAWVECEPTTGRSHQLRVHLAASGAPIVGDALYGGAPGERSLLHAESLRFPWNGRQVEVLAPPPSD
jgi:23S rRNA-/tRNA-specific pseudouridylate synthase